MDIIIFKNVESIEEEIDELKKDFKFASDPEKKTDIYNQIRAKKKTLRNLKAWETWIIIVYTGFFAVIFSMIPLYAYNLTQDCFIRQLFYIGSAGGLGGVIYSILGFIKHYDKGDFNLKKKWWYFFRPITAVILGVISFFFIAGGLMTLSDTAQNVPQGICYPAKGVMFYCAVAFLAGMSNNAFVKKLDELAGTVFKNTADADEEMDTLKTNLSNSQKDLESTKKKLEETEKALKDMNPPPDN